MLPKHQQKITWFQDQMWQRFIKVLLWQLTTSTKTAESTVASTSVGFYLFIF